jgi:predicted Zn-dependent peptidase
MAFPFKRHHFANGLRLVVHEDHTTPLASCFICYFVGSRDEDPIFNTASLSLPPTINH